MSGNVVDQDRPIPYRVVIARPLTMRQRQILDLAHTGAITSGDLAAVLGWSAELMRLELRTLAGLGLLIHEGGNRGSRYALAGRQR